MRRLILAIMVANLVAIALPVTRAATMNVPGTSDPWLANGTIDNVGTPEPPDTAPAQSPVFAGFVTTGATLAWTATGLVGHPGDIAGPDGAASVVVDHMVGANNGIPDLFAPIDSLIGVFTGPSFASIFVMGSSGTAVVPAGATEFFMGTMDGFGWANNIGSFDVQLNGVPDGGSTLSLLTLGLGLLAFAGRNQYRKPVRI